MRKLLLNEQETVITFNAEEAHALIYTAYPPMMRKLDKYCKENPDEWQVLRTDSISKSYKCPKEFITIRLRKTQRQVSNQSIANLRGTQNRI